MFQGNTFSFTSILQIEHFVEHLTPEVVNNQLFPNIVQGFMDSNPVVREHTIKVTTAPAYVS